MIPYRLFLFVVAFAASVAFVRPAASATGPANQAVVTLSLDEAVALSLERAPVLQAQAAAVDAAHFEAIAAGRLPDPELVVGVDNLPATGEEAWSLDRDFMTMRKVGVMQAFPNGRKRAAQRERAMAVASVAQRQARQTRVDVARASAEAWLATHTAELALEQLRTLHPDVALQAQVARAALASARGSTVDALDSQSEVSALNDQLLQAQRQVQATRAELTRWIGEDAERRLAAAPRFDELPAARETLLASLHRHAALQTLDAQRALAQSEIALARAQKRSDWSAELVYANRGAAFADMVSFEFRVGLPLFSRYRQDPQIGARRADLAQLDAEREAQLRAHAAEVEGVLAAWEAARRRIELYEAERLPLARQRTQAALAGFQAGRTELATVLASRLAEIDVQRGYVDVKQALGQAWVFLRYLESEEERP